MNPAKKEKAKEALVEWLTELSRELLDKEKLMLRLDSEIRDLVAKINNVTELLGTFEDRRRVAHKDGKPFDLDLSKETITGGALKILEYFEKPLGINKILNYLEKGGKILKARNKYNMIYTILRRDKRFKRIKPGVFAKAPDLGSNEDFE